MFKHELRRYLKSKATWVVVLLILISVVSFWDSYVQKSEFVSMYETLTAEDISMERLKMVIDNETGLRFFVDYMNGNYSCLEIMVLLAWAGIFLSPVLWEHKNTGYGNYIVTRMDYGRYAMTQLLAQSIYILIVIAIATVLQIVVALCMGGLGGCHIYGNGGLIGTAGTVMVIVVQMLIVWMYICMFNGITMMLGMFIGNKYFLQACPLVVFCVLPMILASSLGNVWGGFADIVVYLENDRIMNMVMTIIQNMGADIVMSYTSVMAGYVLLLTLLTITNIRINKRDYV